MTAQKLTASTSTDSHKAFRQALQLKSNAEQPYSRETGPMPIPQQTDHNQLAAADSIEAGRPPAWGTANSVEPDSQTSETRTERRQPKRHQQLMVVTDTDTDATMPAAAAGAEADGGGGGAAIPMSPPSSPTHVVAAHSQDQLMVARAAAPATEDATTKAMVVDLPPVVAPSPTSTAAPVAAAAEGAAVAAATAAPPAVPIRLGRGRKLCPNCKALTKSAVKQCRECKHIFNPVSQRLRAQHREPKENEEVPMLPRRRHRPSQRLLESLVEPQDPVHAAAAAAGGGGGQAPSAPTRRPLSPASNSGGGNVKALEPPAGVVSKEQRQLQQQQPPKRSHKRKSPLPPGVAPPKRKKGAAAAARLAAATQAAGEADRGLAAAARGILPVLTLPEQQRVAKDLLASPTPSRHTVPESPELAPMATPAGPLLFMASSASNMSSCPLEDDSEWLARGGGGSGGGSMGSSGGGGGGNVSHTTAFVEQQLQQQQLQQQQQQQLFAAGAATSLPGLLLNDDDDEEEEDVKQQLVFPVQRRDVGGSGISPDPGAEGQDKDPFADVEMWWAGGGVAAVVDPTTTEAAGVPSAFPMVGRDGTMQQRVVFPHNANASGDTELLGDSEDALLWNPLRASSAGGGMTAAAGTSAGRTLTLWPGTSNNDKQLLMSAASSSCSSSSSFFRGGNPENVVHPSFERGAAIASAVGAPATVKDSAGSNGSAPGPHGHARADLLLAEASCSSLPEPLVFGSNGTTVAAVSADSYGDGDDAEGGGSGFWNPLFQTGGAGSL